MNKALFIVLSCVLSFVTFAENKLSLPEPLTYQAVQEYIQKYPNFSLRKSQSELLAAQANQNSVLSQDDYRVTLTGYLRKVGVSRLGDPSNDKDSKISIVAKKKLYDFGLTDFNEAIAASNVLYNTIQNDFKNDVEKLNVIRAYFNVLRADNNFLLQNEAMSIAFVRYKRILDNAEFGLSSDISILQAQTNYERVRQLRYLAEAKQRQTRQQLAEILGVPNSPPDNLEVPKLDLKRRIIKDTDLITSLALKNSKQLKLSHLKVLQAKQAVSYLDQTLNATLEAELEASSYQRESAYKDDWRASINFNFPLYEGGRQRSKEDIAKAQLMSASADFDKAQSDIRLKVLELWQQIQQKTVELEGALIKQDYRDLYLERSRADYELEYQSDLGDAMVQFSSSRKQRYDIEFDLELAWRELAMLVGEDNLTQIIVAEKRDINRE